MEKATTIPQKEFESGFFIEMECAFCNNKATIAAYTKKSLYQTVKEEGWKNIDSDQYQLRGHWCGCNYRD